MAPMAISLVRLAGTLESAAPTTRAMVLVVFWFLMRVFISSYSFGLRFQAMRYLRAQVRPSPWNIARNMRTVGQPVMVWIRPGGKRSAFTVRICAVVSPRSPSLVLRAKGIATLVFRVRVASLRSDPCVNLFELCDSGPLTRRTRPGDA